MFLNAQIQLFFKAQFPEYFSISDALEQRNKPCWSKWEKKEESRKLQST